MAPGHCRLAAHRWLIGGQSVVLRADCAWGSCRGPAEVAEQGKFSGTGETRFKHVSADIRMETARCFSESELPCYREVAGELPPPGPGHSRVTPIIQFNLPETNWCEMHKPNSLSDGVLPYILTPVSFCERAFFRRGHTAQEDPGGWCTYVSSHDRVSRTAHYPYMILRVGGSIWFFSVRQVLCSFRPFS